MKYVITILVTAAVLVGCIGGDGGGAQPVQQTGVVGITCADLWNAETSTVCSSASGAAFVAGAVTIIDAGVLQRAELAYVTLVVLNGTADAWMGYWAAAFDAGCAGLPDPWHIAPIQPTGTIDPNDEWTVTVGGQCGDMPLGQRTMTATLYDTDPATVLDVVQVQFELVE